MTTVPNGRPVSEMHERLLAARAGEVEKHTKIMADLDAAISAIVNRHVLPASADRPACRHCGGPMVAEPSSPTGFVHDRDGSPACQPGHSSTVAEPLDHTTMWPAVQPHDATEVLPVVPAGPCPHCGELMSPHEGRLVHTATGDTECEQPTQGTAAPTLAAAVQPGRDVSDTRPDERKRGAK